MKKITLFGMACLVSACSNVQLPNDQHSTLSAAEKASKCQELREEIDNLKGKPLQRGAHLDYYESLCLYPQ